MDGNSDKRKKTNTSHTPRKRISPSSDRCAVTPMSPGCDKQNQFVTKLLPKKVLLQGNANHESLKGIVHLKKKKIFDSLSFFHKAAPLCYFMDPFIFN